MTNKYQISNFKLNDRKVSEGANKRFDIYDRAFSFAVGVNKVLAKVPETPAKKEYARQLIRSAGSIGANLTEADGALTKRDFVNKIGIARREARESRHWLRLIDKTCMVLDERLKQEFAKYIQEATELTLILSAIITKTTRSK